MYNEDSPKSPQRLAALPPARRRGRGGRRSGVEPRRREQDLGKRRFGRGCPRMPSTVHHNAVDDFSIPFPDFPGSTHPHFTPTPSDAPLHPLRAARRTVARMQYGEPRCAQCAVYVVDEMGEITWTGSLEDPYKSYTFQSLLANRNNVHRVHGGSAILYGVNTACDVVRRLRNPATRGISEHIHCIRPHRLASVCFRYYTC